MLVHNNSYVHSRDKDNVIRELLANDSQSVLFLNSDLEIIKINQVADKRYAIDSLPDRSFLTFSDKNSLKHTCRFAGDVIDPVKSMLLNRLNRLNTNNSKPITWHVEYFPELFDTGFKLALVDVTEKAINANTNHFCNSVFETVTSMVAGSGTGNLGAVLGNIIQSLPGRAHIKTAQGFSYQMTNNATLKLLGMRNAHELIGLDDFLVSKHMGKKWPSKLADNLQEMDHGIIQHNSPLLGKEETPYLDAEGNLVIHSLTKIPIYDLYNLPYGILTLAIDITHLKDIMFLKQAYFNLYEKPSEAHYNFIKHLGLERIHADVNDLITIRELECLILFAKGMTAKEIGRHINISHRTVERHFESVKAKFNCLSRSDAISLFLSNFSLYAPGTRI